MKIKLFFILVITFLFYSNVVKYDFSGDDFIHLYNSQANSIQDFLNFFNPNAYFADMFFYRPLSTQTFFFINSSLFGLNALPFHIVALLFHGINTLLFYLVVLKLWKNEKIAFLSCLLYGISAVHFLSLFFISAFQQILRTFFLLLSTIYFLKYQDEKKANYLGFSLLSFVAALISKETSIIFPLLLIPIEMIRGNKNSIIEGARTLTKSWMLFAGVIGLYVLIRLIGIQNIFSQGGYDLSFSLSNIFQNIKWYTLWIFGLPEILSSYPSLKPSSLLLFIRDNSLSLPILITFTILIVGLIVLAIRERLSGSVYIKSFLLIVISLVPVLFLKEHKYPQYLDLALLGFLPILAKLILFDRSKQLRFCVLLSFLILQMLSINLSEKTHWATHRSVVANYYHQILSQKNLNNISKIVFVGDETKVVELSYALALHYGVNVWQKTKNLKIEYQTTEPSNIESILIIPITHF
jgi:hypothetical protein